MGAKCPRDGYYYIYEDALKDAHNDAWLGKLAAEKYVVLSLISKGGMGAVYRAMQLPVQREVAFKVLLAELQDNDKGHDRFAREARAISKLTHPNIITMHDFGVDDDDHPFMVMEYAPGQSLSEWIVQPGLDLGRIKHVFRQILSALSEAHNQGVVHRDLKPENLIVTRSDTEGEFIKLLDFGIARMVHDGATRGLTREGEVFGTPHYMAPEQAQGQKDIGPPADVYALGIMLYEMLSGQCPFDAPTPLSILYMHINDDLPKLNGRNGMVIPDALREIVDKATAKEADDRYANAGEMLDAFDKAVGGAMRSGEFAVGAAAVNDGGEPDKEDRIEKATANTLMFGEVAEDQSGADSPGASSPDDSAGDISSQPTAKPEASKETTFEFEDFGPSRTKKLILVATALILVALISAGVMIVLLPDDEAPSQSEATAQGVEDGAGDDRAAQQAEVAARQEEGDEEVEDEGPAEDGADELGADPAEPAEPDQDDPPSAAGAESPGSTASGGGSDDSADRGDPSPEKSPASNAPAPADSDKGSQDDGRSADSSDTAEEPKDEPPATEEAEDEAEANSDEEPVEDDGPRKFERKNDAPQKFERKSASDDDDKPRKWR